MSSVFDAVETWSGEEMSEVARWRQVSPSDHLRLTAARQPNKEAVRFNGSTLTWGDVDAMANRAATGLLALGAKPNAPIGLLADNSPETLAIVYGASRVGIPFIPLNSRLTKNEVEWQLNDVRAAHFVSAEGDWSVDQVMAAGADKDAGVVVSPNSAFWIRFSSGTTGKPKAIMSTQAAAAALFDGLAREVGYTPSSVGLVCAPLAHAAMGIAAAMVSVGATIVIEPGFNKDRLWEACDEEGVTDVFMVPSMFAMTMESPGRGDTIETFLSMGSVFPVELRKRVAARFPGAGIFNVYGGTEFGAATVLRPEDAIERPDSIGLARFHTSVRVMDDAGNELPPGNIGQLYFQGPNVCSAWVGSVRPSPGTVSGQWVSAGDLGWKDEEGYFYIADRRDDLIISGGFNVYPREVESVLETVDGVQEVAVVAADHPEWGQQVVAFISGKASVEELDAVARRELAGYKVPRRYEFVDEMPRNASGKLLRRVLRDQIPPS